MASNRSKLLLMSVAAGALVLTQIPSGHFTLGSDAYAQGHSGSSGGHSGGSGGQGGSGGKGGQGGQGGALGGGSTGTHGSGQGGPSADSDGQGPKSKPTEGRGGGRPVWAKEGIPEVELGRLNVARSPSQVLDRQLKEALATWVPTTKEPTGITIAQLYSMTASQFAAYVLANFKTTGFVMIDSPLANLALLRDLLVDSRTQLTGVTPASVNNLAAIFIGSAADKSIPITTDTVIALTTIMGLKVTDVAAVAAMAEIVRQAISTAHG